MSRNINKLYNIDPPATREEIRAAAAQFIRKITGFTAPSVANAKVFEQAIDGVPAASTRLLESLVTGAPPGNREREATRAHQRAVLRFGLQRETK